MKFLLSRGGAFSLFFLSSSFLVPRYILFFLFLSSLDHLLPFSSFSPSSSFLFISWPPCLWTFEFFPASVVVVSVRFFIFFFYSSLLGGGSVQQCLFLCRPFPTFTLLCGRPFLFQNRLMHSHHRRSSFLFCTPLAHTFTHKNTCEKGKHLNKKSVSRREKFMLRSCCHSGQKPKEKTTTIMNSTDFSCKETRRENIFLSIQLFLRVKMCMAIALQRHFQWFRHILPYLTCEAVKMTNLE